MFRRNEAILSRESVDRYIGFLDIADVAVVKLQIGDNDYADQVAVIRKIRPQLRLYLNRFY